MAQREAAMGQECIERHGKSFAEVSVGKPNSMDAVS
jgi:hypothetical protein